MQLKTDSFLVCQHLSYPISAIWKIDRHLVWANHVHVDFQWRKKSFHRIVESYCKTSVTNGLLAISFLSLLHIEILRLNSTSTFRWLHLSEINFSSQWYPQSAQTPLKISQLGEVYFQVRLLGWTIQWFKINLGKELMKASLAETKKEEISIFC